MIVKRFARQFTVLAALTAFLGLSVAEAFHTHQAHQTETNCAICQIAHRSPALIGAAPAIGPHWNHEHFLAAPAVHDVFAFVFVSHGLSPPVL